MRRERDGGPEGEIEAWLALPEDPPGPSAFVNLAASVSASKRTAKAWADRYSLPSVVVGGKRLCRRVDFVRARDAYLEERKALGLADDGPAAGWLGGMPPVTELLAIVGGQ